MKLPQQQLHGDVPEVSFPWGKYLTLPSGSCFLLLYPRRSNPQSPVSVQNRGSRQTHIRKSEDHLTEKSVGWASFLSEFYVPIHRNQGKEVCITMAKKAIKCSKMFDSTTSTVRENVVIFTDGERIEAVVPAAEAKFDGYEVIDLTGQFVTPGLCDCHVHLSMNGRSQSRCHQAL